jgi:hypothetical protein
MPGFWAFPPKPDLRLPTLRLSGGAATRVRSSGRGGAPPPLRGEPHEADAQDCEAGWFRRRHGGGEEVQAVGGRLLKPGVAGIDRAVEQDFAADGGQRGGKAQERLCGAVFPNDDVRGGVEKRRRRGRCDRCDLGVGSRLPSFSVRAALVPIRADSLCDRGVSWMMRHADGSGGTARLRTAEGHPRVH